MNTSPSQFKLLEFINQFSEIVTGFILMLGVGIILPFKMTRDIMHNFFQYPFLKRQMSLSSAENAEFILQQTRNLALLITAYEMMVALSNLQTASATATPAPTYSPLAVFNGTDVQLSISDHQVNIVSLLSNITLGVQALIRTIPVQWVGAFMANSPNVDTVIATFTPKNGAAQLTGSPDRVSLILRSLRFSLWDNTTTNNLTQIPVNLFVAPANNVTIAGIQARITVDLSFFGTNAAPIPTNASYANQTVNLNTQFSIDLASPPGFIDPDGDPVTYQVTLADGTPLPPSVQVNNNVLVGKLAQASTLNLLVSGTDGYKLSKVSLPFTVTCKYIPPFVANAILAKVFSVGEGFSMPIPLSTFTGVEPLEYKALANGFPLPKGLDFNSDLKLLTGFMSSDWSGNITIMVTDPYKSSANTTFELSVFDTPPELVTPIATQVVNAKKTIVISIPSTTFVDPDHLPSALLYTINSLADGSPLPSWIVYNANTKQITAIPPVEALGQTFQIVMSASDGYKSTNSNITLQVLPNQPPVVGQALLNTIVFADQDLNYLIPPNSFSSPLGNPLTLSVQMQVGPTQQLPGWINFNNLVNVVYGRPSDTDVGTLPILVIAQDGLGGNATQIMNITVQKSSLSLFLYWLSLAAQGGSGVLFAWSLYLARNQLVNHFCEKSLICEHPFDDNLQHKINHPYAAYVGADRIPNRHEVGKLSRWIANAVSLVSSYFYHQFALAALPHGALPYWLEYHATHKIITLKPELIDDEDEVVSVWVKTLEGRLLAKFTLNPADYKPVQVFIPPKQEQEEPVLETALETHVSDISNSSSEPPPSIGHTHSVPQTPPEVPELELELELEPTTQESDNSVTFRLTESSMVVKEEPLPVSRLDYGFFTSAFIEAKGRRSLTNDLESDLTIRLKPMSSSVSL